MKVNAYWDISSLMEIRKTEDISAEFEKIFIRILLKEMRKSIPDGLFNKSFSSKMYLDMFDMQLTNSIASSDKLELKTFFQNAINSYIKNSK
jgi:flagellar protein FlgJ